MKETPVPFNLNGLNDLFAKPPACDIRSGNTLDAGILLPYLVWSFRADVCVEFGVYQAYTSSILMWSMQTIFGGGTLICFDKDDEALSKAKQMSKLFPSISAHFVKGRSGNNAVTKHIRRNKINKAMLSYVDGGHAYEVAYADLKESLNLLRPNGVIVAHDYFHKKNYGVVKAVDRLCAQSELQKFIMPHPRGAAFAVLRKMVDPSGKHGDKAC